MRRRSSKHRCTPRRRGAAHDSLALVAEQDRQLVEIFNGWDTNVPPPDAADPKTLVSSGLRTGHLRQAADPTRSLTMAAKRDVARALQHRLRQPRR